ncbi:hypothetical protein [Rossellomorea sp. BNER]|uniref:hypothetical protein n=1 Tax=Rossellomorea sp. BNER TaxID=2962031 RepID=UPI003AF22EF3|nr:hypothetical protein [Rossellomorea sp. BNER]
MNDYLEKGRKIVESILEVKRSNNKRFIKEILKDIALENIKHLFLLHQKDLKEFLEVLFL